LEVATPLVVEAHKYSQAQMEEEWDGPLDQELSESKKNQMKGIDQKKNH
jgi:hypothetical protein